MSAAKLAVTLILRSRASARTMRATMSKEPRLPKELLTELEGADWRVEPGKGHMKLFVNGRLAGLVPSHHNSSDRRPLLNTRANIRKILLQSV